MLRWIGPAAILAVLPLSFALQKEVASKVPVATDGPGFTADGQLRFPANYREWVFLTSGLDMSYDAKPQPPDHSVFNNVFVNPQAYRLFQQTGMWPEGTVILIENRGAEGAHSINTRGKTQAAGVMGMEVHVKDSGRLKGGWGFYNFDNLVSAKEIPHTADCYSCHEQHAAVDTTFVQFYPTLLEVARLKGTFSKEYLKETAAEGAGGKKGDSR